MQVVIQLSKEEAEEIQDVLWSALSFVSVVINSPELPELSKSGAHQYKRIQRAANLLSKV